MPDTTEVNPAPAPAPAPAQRVVTSNTLGKVLATVLLGLEEGLAITSQPTILENPAVLGQFISGFTQIWIGPPALPAPAPAPTPAA